MKNETLWVDVSDDYCDVYKCPRCEFEVGGGISDYNYCPRCGMLMKDMPKEYERED